MLIDRAKLPNGEIVYEDTFGNSLRSDISYYLIQTAKSTHCEAIPADRLFEWINWAFEVYLPNKDVEFCEGWLFANEIEFETLTLEELE